MTGRVWTPFAYRIYRVSTWIIWVIAWPWLVWMRSRSREWFERLSGSAVPGGVWVHAASVGEVGAALPLVHELLTRGCAVRVTVVTPAGVEVARRSLPESVPVRFAPLDFVPAVRRALRGGRPDLVILVETELWPNLLHEARANGVPVAMANARLSERSLSRYRSKASPLLGVAQLVGAAVCQSEDDVRRFVRLGFDRSRVRSFGSTKFDTLAEPLSTGEREALRATYGFDGGTPVLVFGSVRPREEDDVVRAVGVCLSAVHGLRVVIAPRHLERVGPLESALRSAGIATARRTELRADGRTDARAVVLDTTGELGRTYAIATAAFVGGTLANYGGHNPLEPAAQGVPVVLGPHTDACRESAGLLLRAGAAVTVSGGDELAVELVRIARDGSAARSMSKAALRVMDEGRGATARALGWLDEIGLLGSCGEARGAGS